MKIYNKISINDIKNINFMTCSFVDDYDDEDCLFWGGLKRGIILTLRFIFVRLKIRRG